MRVRTLSLLCWWLTVTTFTQTDRGALVHAQTAPTQPQPRVITVPAGGDAAAAVRDAKCGDVIELAAGATYAALTLPSLNCGRWTTIRASGTLPDRRIQPSDAPTMATVPSITVPDDTSYWRLIGLRVVPQTNTYGAIRLGNAQRHASLESISHHFELDRVLVDVPDAVQERRGILISASDVVIRRSMVRGVKEVGADSQGIGGWDSPGRVTIDDCDLQAAGEVIMFGGSAPSLPGVIAEDVTITNNDISRPMSWKGSQWQIKNLLEVKAGRRFVIRGNRFSNNWPAAQPGYSILFTARADAPWSVVEDILFEGNTLRNASSGINILAFDDETPKERRASTPAQRITIRNNLLLLDSKALGGEGRCYMLLSAPKDVTIDHNTCLADGGAVLTVDGPKAAGFVFTNNVQRHNAYGMIGSGTAPGLPTLNAFFDSPVVEKNVFAGATATYPPTNLTPSVSDFAEQFDSDMRLKPSSAWKKAGTDGADLGARLP